MTPTEKPGSRFAWRADRHVALVVRHLGFVVLVVAVMGTLILLEGVSG